jgi:hypothetical protein
MGSNLFWKIVWENHSAYYQDYHLYLLLTPTIRREVLFKEIGVTLFLHLWEGSSRTRLSSYFPKSSLITQIDPNQYESLHLTKGSWDVSDDNKIMLPSYEYSKHRNTHKATGRRSPRRSNYSDSGFMVDLRYSSEEGILSNKKTKKLTEKELNLFEKEQDIKREPENTERDTPKDNTKTTTESMPLDKQFDENRQRQKTIDLLTKILNLKSEQESIKDRSKKMKSGNDPQESSFDLEATIKKPTYQKRLFEVNLQNRVQDILIPIECEENTSENTD